MANSGCSTWNHLDIRYTEWVSVPLNHGAEAVGAEPRFFSSWENDGLSQGWRAGGLPLLTPVEGGQLGAFLSRLLLLTTFFISFLFHPKLGTPQIVSLIKKPNLNSGILKYLKL